MPTTSSNLKSDSKEKKSPALPWWVELLFVQIGLPDKWLPNILKRKNKTDKFISEHQKKLIYIGLIILGFVYLNPYTKFFHYQNSCIEHKLSKIKSSPKGSELSKDELKAKAVRLCNSNIFE